VMISWNGSTGLSPERGPGLAASLVGQSGVRGGTTGRACHGDRCVNVPDGPVHSMPFGPGQQKLPSLSK